jgi:DNA-binding Lrp family transcriptional regulator
MKAYVFIGASTAAGPAMVAQQIRRIPGVKTADLCWGQPDIIAVAEAADVRALQELVLNKIQQVTGVSQTDSHLVCEP